jgi:hypothetical protein
LKRPGYKSSVKWIDTRYFFVRDEMEKGTVEFVWIKGDDNMADGLTKPLEHIKFQRFRELLRMVKTSEPQETSEEAYEDEVDDYAANQFIE